jgi:CRISPR-associated protein Csd1
MEVAHGADGPKAFGVGRILRELAPRPDRDTDDVPPNIAADTMRAILQGSPYPLTLLQHVLRRIRAEQVAQHRNDQNVTHARAAILKATLNRFHRIHPTNEKEITVALDITNDNPGYRLGRLFAVLEKIQEDAQPGINATIRDRFYGAASASPVTVFPRLLKLAHHHQSKIKSEKPGFAVNNEKWLSEIIGGIPTSMPAQLAMEDQARFAIGYYHQRQALFTKSTASDSDSSPKETP